jgi:5-methylthioadenosine/S-adenosylhomocysteine deaminase
MNQIDLILNCRWLIPIEPETTIYEDYAIAIHEGKIRDVLPQQELVKLYTAHSVINFNDHVILPGFINAHTHSPMTLFRGLADDLPLMEWLNDHIWPAEKKWLNKEFIQDGTEIAIGEMIKSGTTCFNEHFFSPEVIANTTIEAKIRACIGGTIINLPTNWSKDEMDGFEKSKALFQEFGAHELVTWSLAPHAPYTTTNTILHKISDFSKEHGLPIHMHVHETASEIAQSIEQYGMRPLKRLSTIGLLSNRLQCVHMTQIDEEDIELLKAFRPNIIHCPESNLKLASGNCPVELLLNEKMNIALGTDGAASNNDLNMVGEMQTAALIGKAVAKDATAVSAMEVLQMATINGAKALGLEHKIGSIKKGKSADLIAIDLRHLNTSPMYNPISQIVYSATNNQVTDVFVAGKQLLRKGTLLTLDEGKLLANAQKWKKRIITARP